MGTHQAAGNNKQQGMSTWSHLRTVPCRESMHRQHRVNVKFFQSSHGDQQSLVSESESSIYFLKHIRRVHEITNDTGLGNKDFKSSNQKCLLLHAP